MQLHNRISESKDHIYRELLLQRAIIKYLQHNDHVNYSCEEPKNSP